MTLRFLLVLHTFSARVLVFHSKINKMRPVAQGFAYDSQPLLDCGLRRPPEYVQRLRCEWSGHRCRWAGPSAPAGKQRETPRALFGDSKRLAAKIVSPGTGRRNTHLRSRASCALRTWAKHPVRTARYCGAIIAACVPKRPRAPASLPCERACGVLVGRARLGNCVPSDSNRNWRNANGLFDTWGANCKTKCAACNCASGGRNCASGCRNPTGAARCCRAPG